MKKKSKSKKKRKSSRRTKKGRKRNQASFKGSRKRDDLAVIQFNEYDIVYDPMDDEYSDLVPPEIEKEISVDLYLLAGDNPRKAIHRLKELRLQYPEHPRIYNYLAKAYSYVRDAEKMIEVVEENYRRNPDYLFAKINYAQICLQRGKIHKIPIILDHKFDLKMLYPERNEFHVTEAVSFFGMLGIYFLKIDDMDQSKRMLMILEDIDPDAEMTKELKRQIRVAKRLCTFKRLLNIRE